MRTLTVGSGREQSGLLTTDTMAAPDCASLRLQQPFQEKGRRASSRLEALSEDCEGISGSELMWG